MYIQLYTSTRVNYMEVDMYAEIYIHILKLMRDNAAIEKDIYTIYPIIYLRVYIQKYTSVCVHAPQLANTRVSLCARDG